MKLTKKEDLYLKAKDAYYNTGKPIMSDTEFDSLENDLKTEGSKVINLVGYKSTSEKEEYHITPMLSLDKITTEENNIKADEFEKWVEKTNAIVNSPRIHTFSVLPKYDGMAFNMIVDGNTGKVVHILTRGDGQKGFVLTDKLREIANSVSLSTLLVPNKWYEVRGEIVMNKIIFDSRYSDEFENPRNTVSGILKRDYVNLEEIRDLTLVPFLIIRSNKNRQGDTIRYGPAVLKYKLSFKQIHYPKYNHITETYKDNQISQDIYNEYEYMLNLREKYPYPLDGFVISSLRSDKKLWEGKHHPKGAIAVKFPPEKVITDVIDIRWTVGKTGELTPTAILDPIYVDGSTISKASVYNYGWMVEHKVYPGATVSIAKGGDIIPKVTDVHIESSLEYQFPTEFDGCELIIIEDEHLVMKDKTQSREIILNKILNGLRAFNIKGVGPSMVAKFYNFGITDISDYFRPDLREFLNESGLVIDGNVNNALQPIEDLQETELWQVIYAVQYDNAGKSISKQLALRITGNEFDFKGLHSEPINVFLNDQSDFRLLYNNLKQSLIDRGINIKLPVIIESDNEVTYEMSGSPTTHNVKNEFISDAKKNNWVHKNLNKYTNFLIVDSMNSSSSKMKKAQKLQSEGHSVKIITYEEASELWNA